jgi:hypothetical protein
MTSRFLSNGAPTQCASCGEAFIGDDGRLEAWRFGAHYFCHGCAKRAGRRAPQSRTAPRAAAITSLSVAISNPRPLQLAAELRAALDKARRYP